VKNFSAAGLYFLNHRIGAAMLLVTLVGVFIAAVFGGTSSTRRDLIPQG